MDEGKTAEALAAADRLAEAVGRHMDGLDDCACTDASYLARGMHEPDCVYQHLDVPAMRAVDKAVEEYRRQREPRP